MVAIDNPIIARRFRGGELESLHRGAWALVDTDGQVVAGAGDPDQPIFARSSSKSLQASGVLPLGVVERFGLTDEHVAVMCSSHNGEPEHVAVVDGLLHAIAAGEHDLQCGAATPIGRPNAAPRRITHNCSGKHAGFLAGARVLDQELRSYLDPDSPIQQEIRAAVLRITSTPDEALGLAIDGCSAPTFVLPMRNLGQGIARIANPRELTGDDARSATTITQAAAAHPSLVAGREPSRFDTDVMEATSGRLFSKGGADGVRCIGVVDAGVAFVGKADDGNDRGLVPLALRVLEHFGHLDDRASEALEPWRTSKILNADRLVVGEQTVEWSV